MRALRYSTWLVAALLAPASLASSQPPPAHIRVLMLRGHDPHAPGVVAFIDQLHSVVQGQSRRRVTFYDEVLDFERFPASARRDELVDRIVEKYRGLQFDAILTEGARALAFAVDRVRPRFPGIPIVYGLAFEPVLDFSTLPVGVTGIHHELPYGATLEMAFALQPDAERVVIISGSSANDSVMLATALRDVTPRLAGRQLAVWQDWTYSSLLQRVRTLPPHTITIVSAFTRDQSGQEFNSGDLIASISRWASGPLYGIARNWVGDGIVGGVTMDFGANGARTGQLLLDALDSAAMSAPLPRREVARPAQVVDWRTLARWGLSERQIPHGTTVLFREPTVWERYRAVILVAAVILTAQGALIGLLLVERRRRMSALRVARERGDQLAHLGRVATLGELTAAISHELRQPLAAIRANAQAGAILLARTPSDLSEAREAFADIASDDARAVEVLDSIRALVRKDDPVAQAVDVSEVCERSAELLMSDAVQRGVHLRLSVTRGLPPVIGDPVQLQQVVLNLALNGMDAVQGLPGVREVTIGTSMRTSGEVEIVVRDTGPGLSAEAQLRAFESFYSTKRQGLGMGLAIVRGIVERHRGRVHAENSDGGGACFRVKLPIAASDYLALGRVR